MNFQQLLQQQLSAVIENQNWFVSLTNALSRLTEEEAAVKLPGEHSIKELVIHITYWSEWYLNKFHGVHIEPADKSNEFTFSERSLGADKINWEELKLRLNTVLSGWQNELASVKDDYLLSSIPNSEIIWVTQISGLFSHIVYHTGQIICLRKIQNNWDGRLGVS